MVKRYRREPGDIKRRKSIKADEYKQSIGELFLLRKAADLTQRALAELLGESQAWVSNVENGQRRIDIYEAERWKQACREHSAKEAVRRALETFAALEAAALLKAADASRSKPSALPTVADGASTSQPGGMGLPLAADALIDEPPAAAPDDSAGGPDDGAAPPADPQRE